MKKIWLAIKGRFDALLVSPHLPVILALLSIFLTLPSLWVGLQFDDYLLEQSVIESPDTAINDMFIFMEGDTKQAEKYMDVGIYPWFNLPEGKNAFWRPLSALTHRLDFTFLPARPAIMHAENILWFALSILLVSLFYREILPVPVAGLAALLFTVDDAHGYAVGWISNRNGLMSFAFGILSLWLYHRYATRKKINLLFLSTASFALALFSAEAGIAIFGYLAAYVLVFWGVSTRAWLTLLPHGLIFSIWAYFYRLGDFGGWGTSYIDPVHEPISFLRAAIERIPVQSLALFFHPPAEFYPFVTDAGLKALWVGTGIGLLVYLGLNVYPLIRQDKNLQFLSAGAGLSLLLNSSSLPANRLLFFAGFGGFAILSSFLLNEKPGWVKRPLWVVHLFMAALLLPVTSLSPKLFGNIEHAALNAPIKPTVIILSAPSAFHADFFSLLRARDGANVPERVWYLGAGLSPMKVERTGENTLVIHALDGYISGFDAVFRGADHPIEAGEIIDLSGLKITVQNLTRDGRPSTVSFNFAEALSSKKYQWLIWHENRFVEWQVPAVGEAIEIQ